MSYLNYRELSRNCLLENDTRYITGGLEGRVELGYKHERLHGEYESSE
jgi:hypothetical protein